MAAASVARKHLSKDAFTKLLNGGAYVSGCKDAAALASKELNRQATGPNKMAPENSQDFFKVEGAGQLEGQWKNLKGYMGKGGLLVFDAHNTGSVHIKAKSPPEYTSIGAIPANQGSFVLRDELLKWFPKLK